MSQIESLSTKCLSTWQITNHGYKYSLLMKLSPRKKIKLKYSELTNSLTLFFFFFKESISVFLKIKINPRKQCFNLIGNNLY